MAISGGIDWVATQAALYDFVLACTGIAPDQLVWGGQQAPRPEQPGIIMRLMINDDNNRPWLDTESNPLVIPTITVTSVDDATNTFTKVAHTLQTGDGPVRMGGADLPLNITEGTDYWVIRVDANTFKLADGFVNAINGVAIDLGDAGSGTITLTSTDDTLRAGQEITFVQRSLLKAILTLECYTSVGVGMDMATSILWRIHAKRLLPTQYNILHDADISVIEIERVRSLAGTQGQYLYEPRAQLDVHLYLASEDSENGGIIERTEITREDENGNALDTYTVDVES